MKNTKKKETIPVYDTITATLKGKPYQVANFRCGRHLTEKDRPRKKNWKKAYDNNQLE